MKKESPTVQASIFQYEGRSRIALVFEYDPDIIEKIRKISGRQWSKALNLWHLPNTPNSREEIDKIFPGISIENALNKKVGLSVPAEDQTTESRLFFAVDLVNIDLRAKVKNIVNRRWHKEEKLWSVPDLKTSRDFLAKHQLAFTTKEFPIHIKKEKKATPVQPREVLPEEVQLKVNEFKKWMEQQRYSYSTIKCYLSFVSKFFACTKDKHWKTITQVDITDYNHQQFILKDKSYSTHNQFINAIKLFYTVHNEAQIIPEEMQRPRKSRKLPNILTKDEIKRILSSTGNIKHKCLLMVIYGSGLRIGEALRLRIGDVRSKEKLLYIRASKGAKDRRVPLSEVTIKVLREYYLVHRPKDLLFEGQNGGAYSTRSAQQVMKRACKKAGITSKVSLHTLRHSYATHLLESGVGLRYIQEILGHNSPKTTMLYTHVSGKRLSEVRSPIEDFDL